jgi:hypothetical protein
MKRGKRTMIQTLTINGIMPTKSKAGKEYWKVATDKGEMSCFEKSIVDELEIGKTMDIEVVESNGFSNIRGVAGKATPKGKVEVKEEKAETFNKTKEEPKYSQYCVSYAKDIFCALEAKDGDARDRMEMAINLVKMAHDAFN